MGLLETLFGRSAQKQRSVEDYNHFNEMEAGRVPRDAAYNRTFPNPRAAQEARRQRDRVTEALHNPPLATNGQLAFIFNTPKDRLGRPYELSGPINDAMRNNGIDTPEEKAAFLAQLAVEMGPQLWTNERIDPAKANRNYAGKNGNGDFASGDGYRFRGRGGIQVTGRDNYRMVDFEHNPDALDNPANGMEASARYYRLRKLIEMAQGRLNRDQFDEITRKVNGPGMYQSDERFGAYQRGLTAFSEN